MSESPPMPDPAHIPPPPPPAGEDLRGTARTAERTHASPSAAPPGPPPNLITELRAAAVRGDRNALLHYLRLTRPTAA